MSADGFPPLIYVDLIEDQPKTLSEWVADLTDEDFDGQEQVQAAYNSYRNHFQPFRVLIKSGDNHEPLFKSTESYHEKRDALHAVELAFGTGSNVYLRQHEHGNQPLRMAVRDAN